jgi:hypothetical protein
MKNFLASLTPEDVLAFIVVIGCIFMKIKGVDGGTDNIMTAVISYRFGHHTSRTHAETRTRKKAIGAG